MQDQYCSQPSKLWSKRDIEWPAKHRTIKASYLRFNFSKGSWCKGGGWCNGACCGSWCSGPIRLDIADPTETATDSCKWLVPWRSSSDRHSPFSLSGSIPAASASLYTLRWMLMPSVNVFLISRTGDCVVHFTLVYAVEFILQFCWQKSPLDISPKATLIVTSSIEMLIIRVLFLLKTILLVCLNS